MEKLEKKIIILPHTPKDFIIPWNQKFDMERALLYGGTMAGECYEAAGFEKLSTENPTKARKRGDFTAKSEHNTTHEHIHVGLEIANFSKFLAMTLNNERQLVTSEKSARYTEIDALFDPNITEIEAHNYHKWIPIFKIKIEQTYPGLFNDSELQKKAQENARYMISGFGATKMIHTLPLVQLNRVACFMKEYCNDVSTKISASEFELRLAKEYAEFIVLLDNNGLLDERLQSNKKERKLSMFTNRQIETYFGDTYSTSYEGSIAQYAQSQRHRTIKHSMVLGEDINKWYLNKWYIPEIIKDDDVLRKEWNHDMSNVMEFYPQGKIIITNESGSIDDLFMKASERRCSAAQLEIDKQTTRTLGLAYEVLESKDHPDAERAKQLVLGPRCTVGYPCDNRRCKFPGRKDNDRLI